VGALLAGLTREDFDEVFSRGVLGTPGVVNCCSMTLKMVLGLALELLDSVSFVEVLGWALELLGSGALVLALVGPALVLVVLGNELLGVQLPRL
jgi:hypothetical protein